MTGTKLNLVIFLLIHQKSVGVEEDKISTVTNYTHDERITLPQSQSLYPREINRPTTPIYARGNDSTTKVIEGTDTNKTDTASVASYVFDYCKQKSKFIISNIDDIIYTK